MKFKVLGWMMAVMVAAALAVSVPLTAQTTYKIVPLPGLSGTSGGANSINDRGWATGSASLAGEEFSNALLWAKGKQIPLGTLGGPNSTVAWPVKNNTGLIVGISELAEMNPLGEAFSCWPFFAAGTPTGRICRGFKWENGKMTELPPFPGGYNSYATAANNRGQVVGWAETGVHDLTCDPNFQVLQFIAVIWQPDGSMQKLLPLPGDSTSAATAINDKGQVVGISGDCGIAVGGVSAKNAVIWENGVPHYLGNIGGDAWNTPTAINNQGTVAGFANRLPGIARTFEAFIWTQEGGMRSLGKLPGDLRTSAFGINENNQIVGQTRGGPHLFYGFIWDGVMKDLNSLTEPGSLFLLYANDITNTGVIVGQALDPNTGEAPAYIGIPIPGGAGAAAQAGSNASAKPGLPEKVRKRIQQRWGFDPLAPEGEE
jgi:uncharacterized membrane protein